MSPVGLNAAADITLRPFLDDDIPAMVTLIRDAFAEYQGVLAPPSSAERKTESVLRDELNGSGAFVAEQAGRLLGCVLWHPRQTGIYIDRLAVLPSCRGRGIARRLMARVECLAKERALKTLSLSVRLVLTVQQEFYRRLGFDFHAYGVHEGHSEPTYMVMTKSL